MTSTTATSFTDAGGGGGTGQVCDYFAGPRVSNTAAASGGCGETKVLAEARRECDGNTLCSVLHDFNCDGLNWRACTSVDTSSEIVVADTLACTLVYRCI
eukprot:CAMPEP_0179240044 /NCGR_PEP_ID=MMETSP0797-20121207/15773_1 /TAXON_ID=47934 /ORGANISM="Dinophysis acuminata, Strain DAEP01" /LENGTH=99 /DNA_ID=CAMNT_0020947385 /DNA_START=67 /DNA_END=363 /DNA_ORIENTATION=-